MTMTTQELVMLILDINQDIIDSKAEHIHNAACDCCHYELSGNIKDAVDRIQAAVIQHEIANQKAFDKNLDKYQYLIKRPGMV